MKENILILVGSARKGGNTEALADALGAGASAAGHAVQKIALYDKKIRPCLDCRYCFTSGGACAVDDDMTRIYDALKGADVLVLATPVYFYNFSAQLKCVLDRLHNPARKRFAVRESALLSVCADAEPATFRPLAETYRAIGTYLNWKDRGMVLAAGVEEKGDILGRPELEAARRLGASL